jgi:hypothetical protein
MKLILRVVDREIHFDDNRRVEDTGDRGIGRRHRYTERETHKILFLRWWWRWQWHLVNFPRRF